MKINIRGSFAVVVTTAGLFASLSIPAGAATVKLDPILASDTQLSTTATVTSAGSTFDAPFFSAAYPIYASRTHNATVGAYGAGGSGAGQTAIMSNTADFAASDVPLTQANIDASSVAAGTKGTLASYVQVPVALGGVAIAFHNTAITTNKLYKANGFIVTSAILAKIYTGAITKWNDSAICAANVKWVVKNACALPNANITVVGRSDSSGTTYIFRDYLHTAQPSILTAAPSKSTFVTSTNGFVGGSGNQGVATDLENTNNSLGYVEYSYVLLNKSLDAASPDLVHGGRASSRRRAARRSRRAGPGSDRAAGSVRQTLRAHRTAAPPRRRTAGNPPGPAAPPPRCGSPACAA